MSITEYHAITNVSGKESGVAVERVSGGMEEIRLEQGVIRYRDVGSGPVLVFVHGILVNGMLWRDVVAGLSGKFRCIVPDLPLGSRLVPMGAEADLSPKGVARIVADLIEALDLEDVALIGNDTGGAICQIVISENPERISRLVLTNCDAYEAFFPPLLRPFQYAARFFGTRFVDLLAWTLRARAAQRLLLWTVSKRRPEAETLDAYMEPVISSAGVRRDLTRILRTVSNRYTLEAARSFPNFHKPVLLVWGKDDLVFPLRYAERLRDDFPNAILHQVAESRAFVPEDQPQILADSIRRFVPRRVNVAE